MTRPTGAARLVGVLISVAVLGAATSATAGAEGGPLPPLPNPPQLNELPGANLVPDVSRVPGAPEVQGVTVSGSAPVTDPAVGGSFTAPFAPPGPNCPNETEGSPPGTPTQGPPAGRTAADITCKPAAVNIVVLPDGRILYWDGLEGEENVQYNEVLEIGDKAANDQSRLLTLDVAHPERSVFQIPSPANGGADNSPYTQYLVPGAPKPLASILNDPGGASGALFCSDQVILANGEVLTPGGTQWYSEPHVPGTPYGVAELEGVRSTRLFDPATNRWLRGAPMTYGRWYPSLVTLADGSVFVASGVTKLVKPVYSDHPLMSGTNVEQTETYDVRTGRWTDNGPTAAHPLPLYPRLHLLPDGHVYYDAGGQTFNPFGQAYDEALWNVAASYDPKSKSWSLLGVPVGVSVDPTRPTDTSVAAGFRGSSFSVMLPLVPDRSGRYTRADFLSAGGVVGTTPGDYLATTSSIVDTVTIDASGEHFSAQATKPLNNARWFSTAVVLPTGQVIAFSGANRDEVVGPGTGFAVTQAEMFDPATMSWRPLASAHDGRTYHNVAVLLPNGEILVGGSAPINTLYGYDQTLPGGFASGFRDPSFEVYSPPYLHWGIPQPTITSISDDSLGYGSRLRITTPQAQSIASVVLVRNPALTHLVDGDQRTVVLPIVSRSQDSLTVATPPSGAVAPPGPYMLFINERTPRGLLPSVADQVWVGAPVPPSLRSILAARDHVTRDDGMASPALGSDDDRQGVEGHDRSAATATGAGGSAATTVAGSGPRQSSTLAAATTADRRSLPVSAWGVVVVAFLLLAGSVGWGRRRMAPFGGQTPRRPPGGV